MTPTNWIVNAITMPRPPINGAIFGARLLLVLRSSSMMMKMNNTMIAPA
jgi:hypothetical protein